MSQVGLSKTTPRGFHQGFDERHVGLLASFSYSKAMLMCMVCSQFQLQTQNQFQAPFANAFEPLPTSIGLGISQAPLLPEINTDPLLMSDACGNYFDWSTVPTSLDPQLQYSAASNTAFDPSLENASLQQDFDASLNMNMDLYSNPMDYQGPWDPNQHQQ